MAKPQTALNLLRIYKASKKLESRQGALGYLSIFLKNTLWDLDDSDKLSPKELEKIIAEMANWTEKAVDKEIKKQKRKKKAA